MLIRKALETDLNDVLFVERAAFGSDEEANLVRELVADNSAKPVVSLLAYIDGQAVGHILFTKARLEPKAPISIYILAPLAVVPNFQKRGIGKKLIKDGLRILSDAGVDLVFVLGHPQYYPLSGFSPVGKSGFEAPYTIPEKNSDAWMIKALKPDVIGTYSGKIICAEKLNEPKYWQE
jgi:putative acetyltransferase